ncbi:MAG: hypothetical protein K6L81_08970 [Agarilytica sp.]
MKNILLILVVTSLFACSTMQPPRYAISVDNVQALKKYHDATLMVSEFTQSTTFSPNCRLMGPIEPADGLSFPEFIGKAFNDELKMADIHSEQGTKITGDLNKVVFSSTSGLTNGFWDIGVTLKSSNGASMMIDNKYTFKTGFDAVTACNATADALSPAIQDLINAAVTNPKFESLL